jgi:DNA-binding MarR family transcriptional regulator
MNFIQSKDFVTARDLSKYLVLDKHTAHDLLYTLEVLGYIYTEKRKHERFTRYMVVKDDTDKCNYNRTDKSNNK